MKVYNLDNWKKTYKRCKGDLYDFITIIYHRAEDYGDNFILELNNELYNELMSYDKSHIMDYTYIISMKEMLDRRNIKVKGIKTTRMGFFKIFNSKEDL